MKPIRRQFFLTLMLFCCTHQNIQAMALMQLDDQTESPSIKNLCERLTAPATLEEFLEHGTVFGGKNIQEIAPDDWAYTWLKAANAKLIFRFDIPGIIHLVGHRDAIKTGCLREREGYYPFIIQPKSKNIVWASPQGFNWAQINQKGRIIRVLNGDTDCRVLNDNTTEPADSHRTIFNGFHTTIHLWSDNGNVLAAQDDCAVGTIYREEFIRDYQTNEIISATSECHRTVHKSLDLVGKQQVAAKILFLHLLERGDTEIGNYDHLKKVYTSFNKKKRSYLKKRYNIDLVERLLTCGVCRCNKNETEVMHPLCCESKQILCLACYEAIKKNSNYCPFCRTEDFIPPAAPTQQASTSQQQPIQLPPLTLFPHPLFTYCTIQ